MEDHLAHWRGVLAALTPHHDTWGGAASRRTSDATPPSAETLTQRLNRLNRLNRLKREGGALDAAASSAPPKPPKPPKPQVYGTLSDMPASALLNLDALDALTCARFKNYHGVLYWGGLSPDWPQHGEWGASLVLPSEEHLQMRFWPKHAFLPGGDAEGFEFVDGAYMSTRVTNACGKMDVCTAVLFKPGAVSPGDDAEFVDATSEPRICACRGLHLLMAGLYKRHNHTVSGVRAGLGMSAHDVRGHEAVRSSTYSLFVKDRKDLHKSSDHHYANSASGGPSVMTIAHEFRDVHLYEDSPRRVAEPITKRRFAAYVAEQKRELCPDGDEKAGDEAIHSALACVELLSAEGLMGLLANPFFDGALPDRIAGPHGVGLIMALACRLALHWDQYGLPKPSACDMYANDQLKTIWYTTGPTALPMPDKHVWAIDLVLKASLKGAEEECDGMRVENNIAKSSEMHIIINDHKVFWQRLGQGVITRLFGLGASAGASALHAKKTPFGEPSRLSDPGQRQRDVTLRGMGVEWEGIDTQLVPLATPGARKTAFVRMLLAVETWVRTGAGPEGRVISEANVVAHPNAEVRHNAYTDILSKIVMPKLLQAALTSGEQTIPMAGCVLDSQLNCTAFEHAVGAGCVLFVHGPMLHLTQSVGAYIVAPSQELTCTECDEKVHVLPGVMFGHSHGHCTACYTRRCLTCAEHYAKTVNIVAAQLQRNGTSGPVVVGRTCRKCGAEPAQLALRYQLDEEGNETGVDLQLTQRTRKVSPGRIVPELRPPGRQNGGALAMPSPTGKGPTEKGGVTAPEASGGGSNTSSRSNKKKGGRR